MTLRRSDSGVEQELIRIEKEEAEPMLKVLAGDLVSYRWSIRWLKDGFVAKKGEQELTYWAD